MFRKNSSNELVILLTGAILISNELEKAKTMARTASRHPTELELEILKIIWRSKRATGREVLEALVPTRKLAYTSVVTILGIMTRKGYVRRRKATGGFVYEPRISERVTARQMLRDLVDRVFRGSTSAVLLNLLEDREFDDNELAAIRQMIDDKSPTR